ncbi:MAG: hypothetical protein RI933_427 [Actinomycetota bacterium]
MKTQRGVKANYYFILAAIGLITAWIFNGIAVMKSQDYLAAWFGTEVDLVLSFDIFVVAFAVMPFMIWEGRRLGMKNIWAYIVVAMFTAMAFTFPLFLAMRELKLAKLEAAKA